MRLLAGPTDKLEPVAHPMDANFAEPRLNVLVIGNSNEPLFNRIINIKAERVYLQLENAVDLVDVNEKSLARRSEMEVSQRLPGHADLRSQIRLVSERARKPKRFKASEEGGACGCADMRLTSLEQEPVIPPDETRLRTL